MSMFHQRSYWAVSDRSNALRDMSVSRTPARAASRSSVMTA